MTDSTGLGRVIRLGTVAETLRPLSLGTQQRTQPFNKVYCSRDLGRNIGLSFKSLRPYRSEGKVVKLASASVYRDSSLELRTRRAAVLCRKADEYLAASTSPGLVRCRVTSVATRPHEAAHEWLKSAVQTGSKQGNLGLDQASEWSNCEYSSILASTV